MPCVSVLVERACWYHMRWSLKDRRSLKLSTEQQWEHCQNAIRDVAADVLGFKPPPPRNPWFDLQCEQAHAAKQDAYKAMLHRRTRAARETYELRRKEEHALFRRKTREHEKREIEKMDRCYGRHEARKFYQKVKQSYQGYKARAEACRDENGDLVVESQSMLRIWHDHFCRLYNGKIPLSGRMIHSPRTMTQEDSGPPT